MIVVLLMVIAVTFMVCGHIFKVRRWGLLISVYEYPSSGNLLTALSLGHSLNAVLPIRVGDLLRVFYAGKKLKNGYSFSIATVLVDLYIDLISVGAMFFGLSLIGKGGEHLQLIAHRYMIGFVVIIPLTILCFLYRKHLKKGISAIALIFNERIEFRILYISYLAIASLKDIFQKINKGKFVIYTFVMWGSYVVSYIVFAEAIQRTGFHYTTSDVFTTLFSGASMYKVEARSVSLWAIFIMFPLAICLICSFIARKKTSQEPEKRFILPQMNRSDRLAFLRTYYSEDNRAHLQSYLKINKDAVVLEDNSAGSNASTVVVMKDEKMYFRKYAFDEDGTKLAEQISWIESHQADIPLPIIVSKRCEDNFVTYDMHSYASAVGLFRYIHTMPAIQGWNVLNQALDHMRVGLHSKNCKSCDLTTIQKYIESKVTKNLQIIEGKSRYIENLEKYRKIEVNGKELRTLQFYKPMFDTEHMKRIFSHDTYSDIHGDLTIENIVCLSNPDELDVQEFQGKALPVNYYFIDPNTGNVHDSPFLDYAKMLQSLHGNYEFLMMVASVSIDKNKVNFMMTKSEAYGKVYQEYRKYLIKHFSKDEVLSIYYHEIIHWLRLMPYKIRKNEKMAVVFYTGLLTVLADVWELEHGEEK